MAQKYGIRNDMKSLDELMEGVYVTNGATYSAKHVIQGDVKSYCKFIKDESEIPSPMHILLIIIQHIIIYGVTYVKGIKYLLGLFYYLVLSAYRSLVVVIHQVFLLHFIRWF